MRRLGLLGNRKVPKWASWQKRDATECAQEYSQVGQRTESGRPRWLGGLSKLHKGQIAGHRRGHAAAQVDFDRGIRCGGIAVDDRHGDGSLKRGAEAAAGHGADRRAVSEDRHALPRSPPALQQHADESLLRTAAIPDRLQRVLADEPRRFAVFTLFFFVISPYSGFGL